MADTRKHRKDHDGKTIEYRMIFAASFALYVVAFGIMRLVPGHAATDLSGERHSLISEAWSAAGAAAGYCFMA